MPRKKSYLSDKKVIVTVSHEYVIQETEMSSVKKDESSLRSDELFIRSTFKRTAEYKEYRPTVIFDIS
jgi:hypothetical protein